jgi:hypothetical protein
MVANRAGMCHLMIKRLRHWWQHWVCGSNRQGAALAVLSTHLTPRLLVLTWPPVQQHDGVRAGPAVHLQGWPALLQWEQRGLVGCWQGMDSRQVRRLWQVQPASH